MSPEWVNEISARYIELYEKVTGEKFSKRPYDNIQLDIHSAVETGLQLLHVTSR